MKPFKTNPNKSFVRSKNLDSPKSRYGLIAMNMVRSRNIPEEILNSESFKKHYQKYTGSFRKVYYFNEVLSIHPCARISDPLPLRDIKKFNEDSKLSRILANELNKRNWPID